MYNKLLLPQPLLPSPVLKSMDRRAFFSIVSGNELTMLSTINYMDFLLPPVLQKANKGPLTIKIHEFYLETLEKQSILFSRLNAKDNGCLLYQGFGNRIVEYIQKRWGNNWHFVCALRFVCKHGTECGSEFIDFGNKRI